MTTAPATNGPRTSACRRRRAVVGAAPAVALLLGLVAVVARPRSWPARLRRGAAVGFGMVLTFFGTGAVLVNAVAWISPPTSLLVALLTYTLQVVLVASCSRRCDGQRRSRRRVDRDLGRRLAVVVAHAGLVGVSHHLRDPLATASSTTSRGAAPRPLERQEAGAR